MPLFTQLLTILYTAASIRHLCTDLESTCNCTLAGKIYIVFFSLSLKSERKLIPFSCFTPGTSICFALKQ